VAEQVQIWSGRMALENFNVWKIGVNQIGSKKLLTLYKRNAG
jgi:hypothetical protein